MSNGDAGLLNDSRIRDLVKAAIKAGLATPANRIELLGSVDQTFVAMQLSAGGLAAGTQLLSDLRIMNRVESLADGTVPLRQWLDTAELIASATEEGAVFRAALDEVSRRATGEPRPSALAKKERRKEAIIHRDDTLPVDFLAAGGLAAGSVARLLVSRYHQGAEMLKPDGDPRRDLGTGWVLTPTLLITNHHVVAARGDLEPAPAQTDFEQQAAGVLALFGYDQKSAQGVEATFEGAVAADDTLDYAILRAEKTLPAPPLRLASDPVSSPGEGVIPVNIIQHPDGRPKRAAIRNNLVYEATPELLQYFTDTRGGSSGSPVFDDRWRVVGLHLGSESAEEVMFQGRSTAWVNVGTQISAILEHLKVAAPAIYDEVLSPGREPTTAPTAIVGGVE
jgi:hypothetical protein